MSSLSNQTTKDDNDLTVVSQFNDTNIDIEKAVIESSDKLSSNENADHNPGSIPGKNYSGREMFIAFFVSVW